MKLCALAMLAVLVGCEKPRSWEPTQVDPKLVKVASSRLVIRHDVMGEGKHEAMSTFVLVDAHNEHSADLEVTLGGELLDDSGKTLGTLEPASLRVPKGLHRLFALLETKQAHLPTATGARIEVKGAHESQHPPTVRIKEQFVHPEGDHIMSSGTVVNVGKGPVKAVVIGAFYDADDRPLTRPFMVMALDGDTSHPVHFRSTPEAKKGILFIGQTIY